MSTSFENFQNSDANFDLSKRITQRMREDKIVEEILEGLQQSFIKELGKESIFLSRPERKRLFRQCIKAVLTDLLETIDKDK